MPRGEPSAFATDDDANVGKGGARPARGNGYDTNTSWNGLADDGFIRPKSGETFEMQKINWLWKGWLALGKFHLLAGSKGAGKSTVIFDLFATLSVGGNWPDGTPAPCGDVVVWSGEDGIEDTILPRFYAAGGDLKRIYPIKNIISNGITRPFVRVPVEHDHGFRRKVIIQSGGR
jgi:hypothetical protein